MSSVPGVDEEAGEGDEQGYSSSSSGHSDDSSSPASPASSSSSSSSRHSRRRVHVDGPVESPRRGSRSRRSGRRRRLRAPEDLEHKHEMVNTLFGFRPWKGHISKRKLEERSGAVQSLYRPAPIPDASPKMGFCSTGNVIWAILFGWWLSLCFLLSSMIMFFTIVGIPYGKFCLKAARFVLWPWGIMAERDIMVEDMDKNMDMHLVEEREELQPVLSVDASTTMAVRTRRSEKSNWRRAPAASVVYFLIAYPMLVMAHLVAMFFCWMMVVMIPMAKTNWTIISEILTKDPLSVNFRPFFGRRSTSGGQGEVVLCTFAASNRYYYKYSVFGMNIILVNLLGVVLLSLLLGFLTSEHWREENAVFLFFLALLSVIPLAYYIGKAVSSISAQTSFFIGAFLNATFGTVVELCLYIISLKQGLKVIVQKAVTGSFLGLMLLNTGLSMVFGGSKYRVQKFNRSAAGVSGVLLFLSIMGAFAPTLFYMVYGQYRLECSSCPQLPNPHNSTLLCEGCSYSERSMDTDPVFQDKARYLEYLCAGILPLGYLIGLFFALKTHSHLYRKIHEDDDGTAGGHGHGSEGEPEWSKLKCIVILLVSTVAYALVAHCMTEAITPALKQMGLTESFAGVTLIGLTPNVAEIVNSIQFALQNNITMSLEITNIASIQICLIQMPILVLSSIFLFGVSNAESSFTLIFQQHDMVVIFMAVLIMNYVTMDGRCNYFVGAVLLLVYAVVLCTFWFID